MGTTCLTKANVCTVRSYKRPNVFSGDTAPPCSTARAGAPQSQARPRRLLTISVAHRTSVLEHHGLGTVVIRQEPQSRQKPKHVSGRREGGDERSVEATEGDALAGDVATVDAANGRAESLLVEVLLEVFGPPVQSVGRSTGRVNEVSGGERCGNLQVRDLIACLRVVAIQPLQKHGLKPPLQLGVALVAAAVLRARVLLEPLVQALDE
mmetsp:Transcript_13592/g.56855  ORF Transcript_13592/g.56855 Transcript_13592/m.56855 type:complete len:209 (+) Transcript_13592:1153-1779(+)